MADLRSLPSVDFLLQTPAVLDWVARYGRALTLEALRSTLEAARGQYADTRALPSQAEIIRCAGETLAAWTASTLLPVINATGVILHTNLGRAPLSQAAMQAAVGVATAYNTLEFDLTQGKRGSRLIHAEALLRRLTGAEAALVVNNNAAAVLLALSTLARRKEAIIARSQLVEIGGGFRVPDVMKQSGARLVEVGTTNRVHPADYEQALKTQDGERRTQAALILRVHQSNFRIIGFTEEPTLAEMVRIAHHAGIPLVDDLGSGTLLDTARFGMAHEPMIQESLAAGADLVCFSGDKLLGGPQAGIILGRADLVGKLKKHPLARAIRADKLCLAALSATLLHYLKGEAEQEVPVWRMISTQPETLRARAGHWVETSGVGAVFPGQSTVGGGSLPGETLPSFVLAAATPHPNRVMKHLRARTPPVIARLENNRLLFDPRTVFPEQDPALIAALAELSSLFGEQASS